ncbi:hypothetical protein M413DRAFT_439827 [Hebeloma cylindrosporum]|uniref:OCIA domain-containing protein n=1 Tax=Hebeloma cylindrosporum TaxID=76867 RepID=A0A0C3CWC2_HEBCY|nr:hypothetical protein M413DRAFT_439827 [Hebeloma cylindrosporum h7]
MDGSRPTNKNNAHVVHYNVRWMDSVFKSRDTTEALLSPQREAGNLTSHDYDASLNFLPGYHRYYPGLGLLVATALVFRFRNPKWTPLKFHAVNVTAGLGGFAFGRLAVISAHYKYFCSIENPGGFGKAMENIQSEVGAPKLGLVMSRAYQPSSDDNQTPDDGLQLILPSSNSESSKPKPSDKERSKWEQIRAANNRTARNSSWDSLRQKHERETVNPRSEGADNPENSDVDQYAANSPDGKFDGKFHRK